MRNLPVHWHEGLFLRPQHFQAADRHWGEVVATSEQWDHPYGYGLHRIEFSREALANHQFEIHALEARLRDGTLITLQVGQEPDRLDLREPLAAATHQAIQQARADLADAFATQSVVRVFLAIPKLKLGRANVEETDGAGTARYRPARLPVQDESVGGDDQELELRSLNVRLLLSTDDRTGYEVLPIAQVRRASEGEAKPQLDLDYIPPAVDIQAWPELGRGIVRAVYDVIGQKIEVLSQQVINRGVGLDSRHPGDLDRILMLSELNRASAVLGVLAFAQGVHPFTAYAELCRIAGQLAIFTPERRPAEIPPYDHDDLHTIFRLIADRIEQSINAVRDYEYQQRHFVGVGLGMQVSLEPRWFNSDWHWFIGVKKGELTDRECRDLLSAGHLDWKLGSSRQVEILFVHRAAGLELTPADRPPRALPTGQDWLYFDVSRRDTPAWRDVQDSQTLAMRLKDSLILNRDRLQGERRLVVSYQGRSVTLEFALFAVPVA
jgi:type VI secretion system protein ImpJ